jgi:hypothetical protein
MTLTAATISAQLMSLGRLVASARTGTAPTPSSLLRAVIRLLRVKVQAVESQSERSSPEMSSVGIMT